MSEEKPDLYQYIQDVFGHAGGGDKPYRSTEFNAAAAHVLVLLEDACAAFHRRSFGTASFLAITALEETAKAELFGFRKSKKAGEKAPPDPLRSHRKKHWFAVRETVFMGKRLLEAVGNARCAAIQAEAAAGGLVALREAALYFDYVGDKLVTPREAISPAVARDILLVAIEAADDILVGWTNSSFDLGEKLTPLFEEVAGTDPSAL